MIGILEILRVITAPLINNTYLGNVAASIPTASSLATRLGISVENILNFTISGSNIECKIVGNYPIPSVAFMSDINIDKFIDTDNLVNSLGDNCFNGTTNMKSLSLNGVQSVGWRVVSGSKIKELLLKECLTSANGAFESFPNTYEKTLYIPKMTNLGDASGNNSMFANSLNLGAFKIYTNPYLATNNAGSPDGDLQTLITAGAKITYVLNYTVPNPIANLSIDAIYDKVVKFNFTPPTSANALDFYEVYIDGVFNNKCYGIIYVKDLNPSTTYNNISVYVYDIYRNKSSVSNIIPTLTTNASVSYVSSDTDATTYITNSGITTDSAKESSARLFIDLKSMGIYAKIQSMYLFKGTTVAMQKFNAKNPLDTDAAFRLVFTGAATFSDNGYQTDGSSKANTFFIPSVVQDVNSNGITVVVGTNNAPIGSDNYEMGAQNSGTQSAIMTSKQNNTDYNKYVRLNAGVLGYLSENESRGIISGCKTASNVSKFYKNGNLLNSGTGGGTLPSISVFIGCVNLGGSAYGYSNQRIQMALIHEGLSEKESLILHSVIELSETIAKRKTW